MRLHRTVLLISLAWVQLQIVQSQCWNGYNVRNTLEGYSQLYAYPYPYECNSYGGTVYTTYQPNAVTEYIAPTCNQCNPCLAEAQPIVVVLNGDIVDYDECDFCNMLSLISNLKDQPECGPIYISYPGIEPCGCDYGCGCKCSNCCKNACGCPAAKCDCPCIDSCGCECKKRRQKIECGCDSACWAPCNECDRCNKCCSKPKPCRC